MAAGLAAPLLARLAPRHGAALDARAFCKAAYLPQHQQPQLQVKGVRISLQERRNCNLAEAVHQGNGSLQGPVCDKLGSKLVLGHGYSPRTSCPATSNEFTASTALQPLL